MSSITSRVVCVRSTGLVIAMVALLTSVLALGLPTYSSARGAEGDSTVLVEMCQGVESLAAGDTRSARETFLSVCSRISEIWANNEDAARARSLWYEESTKPFKGEPYERAMAFYYAGLMYLLEQDLGNAQAAFYNSCQQDAFAEEEQNRMDFGLSVVLRAYCLYRQGSTVTADAVAAVARDILGDVPVLDQASAANLVIVVESGRSPRKVRDGVGSFELKFRRGKKFSDEGCSVTLDGEAIPSPVLGDVYWQARSRGGRAADAIIDGKVKFAKTTGNVGFGFSTLGAEVSDHALFTESDGEAKIGLAMEGIGVAALILGAKARPAADGRFWDNLPDRVSVATAAVAPGKHVVQVEFRDAQGVVVSGLASQEVSIDMRPEDKCKLIWISAHPRPSNRLAKYKKEMSR